MLRKAGSRGETPMGHHPPLAFWQPFRFSQRPIGWLHPHSWQAAASVPKGATISAQDRAADRTPIIQGRMNRWPSCHRVLGWQLSLPPLLPEALAGCPPGSS